MHWRSSQIQKVAPEPKEPRLSSPRPRGTLKTKHESWKDTKSKHTLGKSICNNVNENLKVQYYTCLHVIRVTFLPLCLPLCGILVCINQSWLFQFHPHSLKTGKQTERSTYCTLIQEGVVELHKLLLGLFGTEGPEEVSMKVTQLREKRDRQKISECRMNFNIMSWVL